MLLTGTYRRAIDDKQRVAIPKPLREALSGQDLFVVPGTDRSLALYTAKTLEQIGNALSKLSPAAPETRSFNRLFYAQAHPAEIDKQGRLRIPPELASLAGLSSEVVIIGVRDKVELWDSANWDTFLGSAQPSYDDLAERVLEDANNRKNES